jgi:hypothetical protein
MREALTYPLPGGAEDKIISETGEPSVSVPSSVAAAILAEFSGSYRPLSLT